MASGWESRLGESYRPGNAIPSMIAVPTGRRCYWDAESNIVYINQNNEVLPLMSVFQYVAAYSDRQDACRFVLGMCLDGRGFLTAVGGRNVLTACSRWLRRWIHFGGWGAVWLRCYG